MSIETPTEIKALGAKGSRLVIGMAETVYELGEVIGTLEEFSVYSDDPMAPASTGVVHAVGRRAANVLVAADNGIFHTSGNKLLVSPASAALAGLGIVSIAAKGPENDERLWLGTSTGLYTGGDLVYVAFGDRLYELNAQTGEATRVPHSFGTIHDIAHGAKGSVYIAAEQGLFERGKDAGYVQYTLSDGATPAPAHAVVFDPKKGMFAITAAGIVLVNPGENLIGITALPPSLAGTTGDPVAAADDIGNVWIGADRRLDGLRIGSTVTFDADVVPVLEKYCGSCHVGGAQSSPLIPLGDYETISQMSSRIIQRISAGQMPPPSSPAMPAEAFEIILRWEASGRNR